jgi:TonB family protein
MLFIGNSREEAALRARFPDDLSTLEITVETLLGVFLTETGRVEMIRIIESSGYPELDQIARDVVVEIARFRAATDASGLRTPVWVGVPMGFENVLAER